MGGQFRNKIFYEWFNNNSNTDNTDSYLLYLQPPIIPVLTGETDTANFEDYGDSNEWFALTRHVDQQSFELFSDF